MAKQTIKLLLAGFMMLPSARSAASIGNLWTYIKKYQIGIDYASSQDNMELSYRTYLPINSEICNKDSPEVGAPQHCTTRIKSGSSSGFGLVLQQAFKKKGVFFWDFDIGFAARYLQSKLPASESGRDGLPLLQAEFSLAALVAKPYLVFGVTPDGYPDVLFSFGPALQLAGGSASINNKKKNVVLGTGSGFSQNGLLTGFTQLEIVFVRFGDGALSLFTARDFTGGIGTGLYPGEVDGMDDFRANFVRGVGGAAFGLGIKLILDWP